MRRIGEQGALRFDQVQLLLGELTHLGHPLPENPTRDKVQKWVEARLVTCVDREVPTTPPTPGRTNGRYFMPTRRWLSLTSSGASAVGVEPLAAVPDEDTLARAYWADLACRRAERSHPAFRWVGRGLLSGGDAIWQQEGAPPGLPALLPPFVDGLFLPPPEAPDQHPVAFCVRPSLAATDVAREFADILACRPHFVGWLYCMAADRSPGGPLSGLDWELAVMARRAALGNLPNAEQGYLQLRPLCWLTEPITAS